MTRTVADAGIESVTKRAKLKARPAAYFRSLTPGLHIGFRKAADGTGAWVSRRYLGQQRYAHETLRGIAEDREHPADGDKVLSYEQAVVAAVAFGGDPLAKARRIREKLTAEERVEVLSARKLREFKDRLGCCERCGFLEVSVLQWHHADRNRKNSCRQNFELLCPSCHALEHHAAKDGIYHTLRRKAFAGDEART